MSDATEGDYSKPDDDNDGAALTNKKLKIFVKHQSGPITEFMIKPHMQMDILFNRYANHLGVDVHSLRFLTDDGTRIGKDKTPQKLGLKDEDEILCMLEQEGGGGGGDIVQYTC